MKNTWDKVEVVQIMQDYILEHIEDGIFPFEDLYLKLGYSKRHANRIFKELLNKTPQEYVRSIRLSNSAKKLLDNKETILNIALDSSYNSHEGYAKAFNDVFGMPPNKYKKGKNAIPLFIPHSIKGYYIHLLKKESNYMENKTCLCMITPVQRPKRKLIIMYSKKANDYFSYCEEMSCDWEGLFNSISSKLDTAAILTLSPVLTKQGYGNIASGIEVPYEYDGEIPDNCEIIELPSCEMLYFQSQPFKTDEEFFTMLGEVFKAVEVFDAASYGYEYADDIAPRFNFGGECDTGAKLAIPVRRINT